MIKSLWGKLSNAKIVYIKVFIKFRDTKIKKLKSISEFLWKNKKLQKLVIKLLGCRYIKNDEFELLGKALQ